MSNPILNVGISYRDLDSSHAQVYSYESGTKFVKNVPPNIPQAEFLKRIEEAGYAKPVGSVGVAKRGVNLGTKAMPRHVYVGGIVNMKVPYNMVFIPGDRSVLTQAHVYDAKRGTALFRELKDVSEGVVAGTPSIQSLARRYQTIAKGRNNAEIEAYVELRVKDAAKVTATYFVRVPIELPETGAQMLSAVNTLIINPFANQGFPYYYRSTTGAVMPGKLRTPGELVASEQEFCVKEIAKAELREVVESMGSRRDILELRVLKPYLFVCVVKGKTSRYSLWKDRPPGEIPENIERGRPYKVFPFWYSRMASVYEERFKSALRNFWDEDALESKKITLNAVGFNPFGQASALARWIYDKPFDVLDAIAYGDDGLFKVRIGDKTYLVGIDFSSMGPSQAFAFSKFQTAVYQEMGKFSTYARNILSMLQTMAYRSVDTFLDSFWQAGYGNGDGTSFTTFNNTRVMGYVVWEMHRAEFKTVDGFIKTVKEVLAHSGLTVKMMEVRELPSKERLTFALSSNFKGLEDLMPAFLKVRLAYVGTRPVCVFDRKALMEAMVQPSGDSSVGEGKESTGQALLRYFSLSTLAAPYDDLYEVLKMCHDIGVKQGHKKFTGIVEILGESVFAIPGVAEWQASNGLLVDREEALARYYGLENVKIVAPAVNLSLDFEFEEMPSDPPGAKPLMYGPPDVPEEDKVFDLDLSARTLPKGTVRGVSDASRERRIRVQSFLVKKLRSAEIRQGIAIRNTRGAKFALKSLRTEDEDKGWAEVDEVPESDFEEAVDVYVTANKKYRRPNQEIVDDNYWNLLVGHMGSREDFDRFNQDQERLAEERGEGIYGMLNSVEPANRIG